MATTYLTRKGQKKLAKELDHLKTVRRMEVAERLSEAMEERTGEAVEDADYDAAKNEQAFVEGRIKELEILLANAQVIKKRGKMEEVQVGAKVTIKEGRLKPEVYTIVGAAEANPRKGFISNESPLGRALLGHKEKDSVEVEAPNGSFKVRIVKIE